MILDTCALLWLAAGSNDLTRNTLKKIEETNVIYVSAIVGFEIAIKAAKGKLKLSKKTREWFDAVVSFHRLTVLPLNLNICLGATELAPFHNDSCDRFIIIESLGSNLNKPFSSALRTRSGSREENPDSVMLSD
jgi:PIN domain nuclease of toxin-antitoxin system